jgi:peroxiredoxin
VTRRTWGAGAALIVAAQLAAAQPAPTALPVRMVDVQGRTVDVAALTRDSRVFVLTLKTTQCPVCREQLVRLRKLLPRLRGCGASFVVLAPGERSAVAAVAEESGFPFPFVADTDRRLARGAGLVRVSHEMEPAILELNAEGRVIWERRGRAAGDFSDPALLERLACLDLPSA